jgi:exodeoxyribonuclease V beta subunit
MSTELQLADQKIENGLFVEASAGTGKTFSVAALIVRELAMDDNLSISEILVTTFTRAAAAELRDRIRRRIVQTARALEERPDPKDDVVLKKLLNGTDEEIKARRRNLMRAVVEFDTATIATIHSICSKVISLAGETSVLGNQNDQARIISEVVNDLVVSEIAHRYAVDVNRIIKVVESKIGEPLTEIWFDTKEIGDTALLSEVYDLVVKAIERVETRLTENPVYDSLIRDAARILSPADGGVVGEEFRRRYKYLIVDEAQDTDAQQWAIFRKMFPYGSSSTNCLMAVGDPKQSIYKFRGADIYAYREERDKGITRTLSTNYRSDGPMLNGLNALFAGTSFGAGIDYTHVTVAPDKSQSALTNLSPIAILNIASMSNKDLLAEPIAQHVLRLVTSDATVNGEKIQPSDIVVLVKTGNVGRAIERELRLLGVPAVSAGTTSVMKDEMAEVWRVLLRALARPSDAGRARHLLSTPLFDVPLKLSAVLDDGFIAGVQETIADWAIRLRAEGVAALAMHILSDPRTVSTLSAGKNGERNLTDFSHVTDLLNAEMKGSGCSADAALEAFARLSELDDSSEIVSRRVESDAHAVQIMTVFGSKGLEFPVVVVADLWKEEDRFKPKEVPIFHLYADDERVGVNGQPLAGRVMDLGFVTAQLSSLGDSRRDNDTFEELARHLYVAATRAKHHLCLAYVSGTNSVIDKRMDQEVLENGIPGVIDKIPSVVVDNPTPFKASAGTSKKGTLEVAMSAATVKQTYQRTSFTGITNLQKGEGSTNVRLEALPGDDEGAKVFERKVGYASSTAQFGVPSMPLSRIPGGTHIGKILHSVYEKVDPAHPDLRAHVASVVKKEVRGKMFADHGDNIIDGIVLTLTTPLGGPLAGHTLASLGIKNRAAEMSFEMSLAHLADGVVAKDIGVLLQQILPATDVLAPYAAKLADDSFNIPLAGLINGSIDALLRVVESDGSFSLFISDYKSNRLDRDGDAQLIDGYSAERMLHEMEHHHYPLQAIIYGAAVYRYLRWRSPQIDADKAVRGFAYMFIRGMVGEDTPVDMHGNRHGIFTWQAPAGFWARVSELFAGVRP